MASNEQAAPRARELQVTVESLQKALQQSKAELTRYKSRAHKAEQELAKVGWCVCVEQVLAKVGWCVCVEQELAKVGWCVCVEQELAKVWCL